MCPHSWLQAQNTPLLKGAAHRINDLDKHSHRPPLEVVKPCFRVMDAQLFDTPRLGQLHASSWCHSYSSSPRQKSIEAARLVTTKPKMLHYMREPAKQIKEVGRQLSIGINTHKKKSNNKII